MTEVEWLACAYPAEMIACCWHDANPEVKRISERKMRLFACACCRSVWHLLTDCVLCLHCSGRGWWIVDSDPNDHSFTCSGCHGTGRINRSRRVVEVAERFADGEATKDELSKARSDAADARNWGNESPESYPQWAAHVATCIGPESIISVVTRQTELSQLVPPATQAALLRDIVGNPFRPVRLPAPECKECGGKKRIWTGMDGMKWIPCTRCPTCPWLTPTVIARTIYEQSAFADLPILADALEDAGCDNADILNHLRAPCPYCKDAEPQEHVREAVQRGVIKPSDAEEMALGVYKECVCKGTQLATHVRGCWALDLLLGKE